MIEVGLGEFLFGHFLKIFLFGEVFSVGGLGELWDEIEELWLIFGLILIGDFFVMMIWRGGCCSFDFGYDEFVIFFIRHV